MLKLRYILKTNAPEYLDAEASDNPEVNKDQDTVATSDPEGPEDMDSGSSFILEAP